MERTEFAILHNLEEGQFLVDTTYNHDTNEHELSFKFWASNINGYATMTFTWLDDKEQDFISAFEKFKNAEFCKEWIKKINA